MGALANVTEARDRLFTILLLQVEAVLNEEAIQRLDAIEPLRYNSRIRGTYISAFRDRTSGERISAFRDRTSGERIFALSRFSTTNHDSRIFFSLLSKEAKKGKKVSHV